MDAGMAWGLIVLFLICGGGIGFVIGHARGKEEGAANREDQIYQAGHIKTECASSYRQSYEAREWVRLQKKGFSKETALEMAREHARL